MNPTTAISASASASNLQAWFHVARHTYAIVDAQTLPQIVPMLSDSGLVDWGRLHPGAAATDGAEAWCLRLTPELPLSHWLLAGEGAGIADWGVIACSDASFREVRQHLRGLLEVQMPRGERVALRWYRPPVLHTLLPLCSASQLTRFFGPVRAFATVDGERWRWLRQTNGKLDEQTIKQAPVSA